MLHTLFLAAYFTITLIACTPTLDWRSSNLRPQNQALSITFPGKPLAAQRTVSLNQAPHLLTLHGVLAGNAQFVLGSVPAADASTAQSLANALAQAFEVNLNAQGVRNAVQIPSTLGAFDVRYPALLPQTRTAKARFFWTNTAAYELLVVGDKQDLTPETADTFIRSLKLEP